MGGRFHHFLGLNLNPAHDLNPFRALRIKSKSRIEIKSRASGAVEIPEKFFVPFGWVRPLEG
jgi:hypothetical protein